MRVISDTFHTNFYHKQKHRWTGGGGDFPHTHTTNILFWFLPHIRLEFSYELNFQHLPLLRPGDHFQFAGNHSLMQLSLLPRFGSAIGIEEGLLRTQQLHKPICYINHRERHHVLRIVVIMAVHDHNDQPQQVIAVNQNDFHNCFNLVINIMME